MNSKLIRLAGIALALVADPLPAADIYELSREGNLAGIAEYVQRGGAVNTINADGYPPLILAAYHGHLPAVQALHAAGADACAEDTKGNDALMGVAFKGDSETARWLVESAGCNVNHRNRLGQTALMLTALFDRETIAELLLRHGADPELRDALGNSAASLARSQGQDRFVAKLRPLASLR
ncbi:ankyrin repeat domain-containing protein [Methylomonas sp. MED-D]|uniref:ankyrin repeat domain-containing protein n=1 Tax=unclassified Methylomonas TaxID=2608980 RepID=UPI0028A31701|nr:ankyrin repeat domain-containing protein [Methylomonas sp. MV1]MDT4330175.1 ankyrin repeat domain-containing protein [Methylomonas sp. MV1]